MHETEYANSVNWNKYKTLLAASLRRRGVTGAAQADAIAAARDAFEECERGARTGSATTQPRLLTQPLYAERKDTDLGPFEFFAKTYGKRPPFADELRRHDEPLYRAMSVKCSRNRQQGRTPDSLSDFMPLRPEARGGSIAAHGKVITPENAWEALQRRRTDARKRMRTLRGTDDAKPR